MVKEIVVLRYGHRTVRDMRVTTHCCLAARALGAKEILIEGNKDESIEKSVSRITKKWGGGFRLKFVESWRKELKKYKKKGFFVVHLTMYGLPVQKISKKLGKKAKILIVIGSQKVVAEVYKQADLNVSITTQPHSEIAALAIALDRLQPGKALEQKFPGAKISIVPMKKGKKVLKKK